MQVPYWDAIMCCTRRWRYRVLYTLVVVSIMCCTRRRWCLSCTVHAGGGVYHVLYTQVVVSLCAVLAGGGVYHVLYTQVVVSIVCCTRRWLAGCTAVRCPRAPLSSWLLASRALASWTSTPVTCSFWRTTSRTGTPSRSGSVGLVLSLLLMTCCYGGHDRTGSLSKSGSVGLVLSLLLMTCCYGSHDRTGSLSKSGSVLQRLPLSTNILMLSITICIRLLWYQNYWVNNIFHFWKLVWYVLCKAKVHNVAKYLYIKALRWKQI